jgi:hypothetical protein
MSTLKLTKEFEFETIHFDILFLKFNSANYQCINPLFNLICLIHGVLNSI